MKLLLVEDAEEIASLVQFALEAQGWQVDWAHDGASALRLAQSQHQVWLIDVGLPDMSGAELLGRLRQQPELASTPAVWFTAHGPGEPGEPPLAEVVGVIRKPFNPGRLAQDLAGLLSL